MKYRQIEKIIDKIIIGRGKNMDIAFVLVDIVVVSFLYCSLKVASESSRIEEKNQITK